MTLLEATVPLAAAPTLTNLDRQMYVESFVHRWDGNTRASYRDDLKMFFAWCDTHQLDVFAAHRTHLELYMRYLAEERGNCASTICHRIGTLKLFYEIALDDDLVRKNPCRLLRLPKARVDQNRQIALDFQEFNALIAAAAESRPVDYALIMIMGVCGLRVSEACSLDVESSLIMTKAHRMFSFVQKGGDLAQVPQPPIVMQAVDRVIAGRSSGPLLLRRDGSRMTRSSADRVVKRLARKAGIERTVSPHVLRHTAAITAHKAHVPMEIISRSLRHKDIGTTYRFYNRGVILTNEHSSHVVAGQILAPEFT
ncbi:MAG: tyrosine-type recombinase/integrase [Rhodococcus sp. (in: high G+C Gram-positive bacteria)]